MSCVRLTPRSQRAGHGARSRLAATSRVAKRHTASIARAIGLWRAVPRQRAEWPTSGPYLAAARPEACSAAGLRPRRPPTASDGLRRPPTTLSAPHSTTTAPRAARRDLLLLCVVLLLCSSSPWLALSERLLASPDSPADAHLKTTKQRLGFLASESRGGRLDGASTATVYLLLAKQLRDSGLPQRTCSGQAQQGHLVCAPPGHDRPSDYYTCP